MPEQVPSNHEIAVYSLHWSGTSTVETLFGNDIDFCWRTTFGMGRLAAPSSRRISLDMPLILADAQVPGVTVRGGR